MKKLSMFISLTLISAFLFGCSASTYRILEDDGQYYLILGNRSESNANAGSEIQVDALGPVYTVHFDSIAEMKSDIESGNFTERELEIISNFDKNEQGRIQICDISKLYEPVFPYPFDSYTVYWSGDYYDFTSSISNSEMYANFNPCSQDYINKKIDYFTHLENNEGLTVHSKVVDDINNVITYDYTVNDSGLQVHIACHRVISNNKELFVVFTNRTNDAVIIPPSIRIYGKENDQCFYVFIYDPSYVFSIDELSQFGIREYVETVTE